MTYIVKIKYRKKQNDFVVTGDGWARSVTEAQLLAALEGPLFALRIQREGSLVG